MDDKTIINNVAKAIKFMATNPTLTEQEIIKMFSQEGVENQLDKLLKN